MSPEITTYAEVAVGDTIRLGSTWHPVVAERTEERTGKRFLTLVDTTDDERFERDAPAILAVHVIRKGGE